MYLGRNGTLESHIMNHPRSNRVDCEHVLEEAEELRLQLEQDDMGEYEENLESI